MDLILPFKVGDAVELRSFTVGYRGAWFRCKITDMCIRYDHMHCELEYIDYPEEKRSWTRLFQILPKYRRKKACQNRELMLRPSFPQWCYDNHTPQHGQKMDVVAVVSSPWKVGDLVDWWHTACFWTGKIIELLDDDKVKIVCPEIPSGEGGSYDADLEDLRPALDWSLEKGWSAPLSQENGECWYTARLITENPDTGSSSDEDIGKSYDGDKKVQKCLSGSFDTAKQETRECLNGASVTPEKALDPDVKHPANTNGEKVMDPDVKHPANTIGRCYTRRQSHREEEPQKCRSRDDPDTSPEVDVHSEAPDEIDECRTNSQAEYPTSPMANSGQSSQLLITNGAQSGLTSCKKLKTSTDHTSVLSPAPGTVGEALMEVEELARRIRRAQDLLQSIDDDDAPSSRAARPAWKFRQRHD